MAALGLAGAVALASSIALGGCFGIYLPRDGNTCEIAATQLRACLGTEPSKGPTAEQCTDENLCVASCINAASCDELKDAFGGVSSPLASAFTDCARMCFPESPPPG